MSMVSPRTKTTIRHEWTIPAPAVLSDVQLGIHLALKARDEVGLSNGYDDSLMFDHDDDKIVIYWEEEV